MSSKKWQIKVDMVLTPVIPALRRLTQDGLQDSRASLCSTVKNRPAGLQVRSSFKKKSLIIGWAWLHTSLTQVFKRQRQVDYSKFEYNLVHTVNSKPAIAV